jgi:hypothetical protein
MLALVKGRRRRAPRAKAQRMETLLIATAITTIHDLAGPRTSTMSWLGTCGTRPTEKGGSEMQDSTVWCPFGESSGKD